MPKYCYVGASLGNIVYIMHNVSHEILILDTGACPGGGPKGPGPPPLEIEKQKKKKKKKKKVIRANIKLFHLYFATFLVENVFFSGSF